MQTQSASDVRRRFFPRASGKNGLEGVLRVAEILEKNAAFVSVEPRFFPARSDRPLPQAKELVAAWTAPRSGDARKILRDALDLPFVCPYDFTDPNAQIAEFSHARRVGKWLALGILCESDETPELLADALSLGKKMAYGAVISGLVGVGIRSSNLAAASRAAGIWTPSVAGRVGALLARAESAPIDLAGVVSREVRFMGRSLSLPDALKKPFEDTSVPDVSERSRREILRLVADPKTRRALASDVTKRLSVDASALVRDAKNVALGGAPYAVLERREPAGDPVGTLAWRLVASVYRDMAEWTLDDLAKLRLLRITASLWQQKKARGVFPKTIPDTPRDPYTGGAFLYEPSGSDFDLSSAGKGERFSDGGSWGRHQPLRLIL